MSGDPLIRTVPARQGLRLQCYVLKRYAPFYLAHWPKLLLLLLVLPVVGAIVRAVLPVLTILLVDEAIPRRDYGWVVVIVTAAFTVALGTQGLYLLEGALRYILKMQILRSLGERFYQHMLRMSMGFHSARPVGERVFRNFIDVHDASTMLGVSFPQAISMMFQGLLTAAVTAIIDARAVIVMLAFFPPYFLLVRYSTIRWRHTDRDMRERRQMVTAQLQQSFSNILVVKAASRESEEGRRYAGRLFPYLRAFYRWFAFSAVQEAFVHPAGAAVLFAMLTSAIWGYWHIIGQLSLGQWFALQELVLSALIALAQVGLQYQTLSRDMVAAERVLDVLDLPSDLPERPTAHRPRRLTGAIECRDISFGYDPQAPILHDIAFRIAQGERVAFVGPSGSGKSTLLSLLLRYHDPDTGAVLVDGHDLRDLKPDIYRRRLGVVLQNPQVFGGTVRENLTYGRALVSEDRIQYALELSDSLEFVRQMPHGIDTVMGEGGDLSGGQRQRLTIARALVRDPDILLLDEPFISLDGESAARVAERILHRDHAPTTVFFTHSPAIVRGVDRVFVMDGGRIVESGRYDTLMAGRGALYRLVRAQSLSHAGADNTHPAAVPSAAHTGAERMEDHAPEA